jgi:hypothetical protein
MFDLLGSTTLSSPDKAGIIGLAVAVLIYGAGYLHGKLNGARGQREHTARPVATLFQPTTIDKYYE